MCQFCMQHGEGKKWYLQAKNYARELVEERRQLLEGALRADFPLNTLEEQFLSDPRTALSTLFNQGEPISGDLGDFRAQVKERMLAFHYGQVVPLEDAEAILDHAVSVVRLPCICRSALLGQRDARFCYGFISFEDGWWPKKGELPRPDLAPELEVLTVAEAKDAFRRHDQDALVHQVYTVATPFILGICNCTTRDCVNLRARAELGLDLYFKGEYLAAIDQDVCTGCRECMSACNFGAISYSSSLERCLANVFQCAGCGLCRAACQAGAISLRDRLSVPAAADNW